MDTKIEKYLTFRNILILGLLVSVGVTVQQFLTDKHLNFQIFYYSTQDFWNGISPYSENWWRHGLDYFIYAPGFSVLFGPLVLLPMFVAGLLWNLGSMAAVIFSIYSLPRISKIQKAYLFLFIVLLAAPSQMTFQYNMLICAMFLWAFSLLEQGKYQWATLLIMLSACTKIYGSFELLLLLCYPNFWKSVGWSVLWGVLIAVLLPATVVGFDSIIPYYQEWVGQLSAHRISRSFDSFFDIKLIWGAHQPSYMPIVQLVVFMVVTLLTFLRRKLWDRFDFKVGLLAVIMGIIPIDLICPKALMELLLTNLDLNNILYTLVWFYIVWDTFWSIGKRELVETKT